MLINDFDDRVHSLGLACFFDAKQRTRQIGIPTPLVPSDELWVDDYVQVDPLISIQIRNYNEHKGTKYNPEIYNYNGDVYYKVDSLIARFIRSAIQHRWYLVTLEHVDYKNHLYKLVCNKRRVVKEDDEYEI